MTSRREWKRRAIEAESNQVKFIDGYRVAMPYVERDNLTGLLSAKWDGKGDVVLMTVELFMDTVDVRNDLTAQRDRARDTAAALEAEIARIKAAVEAIPENSYTEQVDLEAVLACFDAVTEDEAVA